MLHAKLAPPAAGSEGPPPGTEREAAGLLRHPQAAAAPGVALLLLARLPGRQVPWAVSRLIAGPRPWLAEPGARFARVLGSGRGGGFGLQPGLDHQGVFAMFDRVDDALACAQRSRHVAAYLDRADEALVAVLQATSARGSWGGQGMQAVAPAPAAHEPVLALTRASIRPASAWRFWRRAPEAERALAAAAGCRFAVGLGEAPVLRQATVSLWDSVDAMNAYARGGAHGAAIAASWQQRFFSEWMFVRFVPVSLQGRWHGRLLGLGSVDG